MGTYINEIGNRYGKLTVIARAPNGKHGETRVVCKCDCGNVIETTSRALRGAGKSDCGCGRSERFSALRTTHGLTHSRIHRIWSAMKQRCYNTKADVYDSYGGRGIKVCDEWRNDFLSFCHWAMDNGYSDELTIDRIDPDGNYEPSNCRWISQNEQCYNRRNTLRIECDGESHTVKEWSEITGISQNTIRTRYYVRHWSPERTLKTPVRECMTIFNNAVNSGKRKAVFWIDKDVLCAFGNQFDNNVFAMSEFLENYLRQVYKKTN